MLIFRESYTFEIMKILQSRELLYLSLILLLAAVLRLLYIDFQSPWLDEIITLKTTSEESSYSEIFNRMQSGNQHLPMYYVILHSIAKIFGQSYISARVISAIFGIAGVGMMYLLSKEFYKTKFALVPVLFTAVNFFLIQYSQEARMYSLLFLGAVTSMYFLVRLIKTHSVKNAVLFGVSVGIFLNIHIFSIFTVLAHGLILLYFIISENNKKLFFRGLISLAVALVLSVPVIYVLTNVSGSEDFWLPEPGKDVLSELMYIHFGQSYFLLGIVAVFGLFGIFSLLKHKPEAKNPVSHRNTGLIILSWLFIPFLVALIISLVKFPIIEPRYLISIIPATILLFSSGIYHTLTSFYRNITIALFTLLSLGLLFFYRDYYREVYKTQFREVIHNMESKSRADKTLIVSDLAWYVDYFVSEDDFLLEYRSLDDYMKAANSTNNLPTEFWYFNAHGHTYAPSDSTKMILNEKYVLTDEINAFDAYAKKFTNIDEYGRSVDLSDVDFNVTESGENIIFFVENFEIKPSLIRFKAWSYLENSDSNSSNAMLILVKEGIAVEVLPVVYQLRPDLNEVFPGKFDLSHSGIDMEIPTTKLDPGNYKIYLLIKNGAKQGLTDTQYVYEKQ